jgi:hypothetical protein
MHYNNTHTLSRKDGTVDEITHGECLAPTCPPKLDIHHVPDQDRGNAAIAKTMVMTAANPHRKRKA